MSAPAEPRGGTVWLRQAISWFERGVIVVLVVMLVVSTGLATLDLGSILVRNILAFGVFALPVSQLLELFGLFLVILIGIELLETVKAYLKTHVIKVGVVLEVALIAIARKIIALDLEKYSSLAVLGIAALLLAVALALYLMRHSRRRPETRARAPTSRP